MGHALLNAEGTVALGFLFVLILRLRPSGSSAIEVSASSPVLCLLIATIVSVAFWPNLNSPLLHDSYGLVYLPSRQSSGDIARMFYAHPSTGDFFFRPLAYFAYWLYSKWAHFDAFRWHLGSLAAHVVNSVLVYILARRLSFLKPAAFASALIFALHGSRPEAVAWAASRVDLLATFFVLLTLLSLNRLLDSDQVRWYLAIAVFTVAALLSKESAYCIPFLTCAMLFLRNRLNEGSRVLILLVALCAAVFCYRFWVIGSIGGYGAASGDPAILHFSFLRTLNALFFRQWALLFFPINWSEQPGLVLWLTVAALAAALIAIAIRPSGNRRPLLAALAMTIAAALPVEHLLLIGSDLNGARVLYLPVLGFALFWGLIVQSRPTLKGQALLVCGLLAFQTAALEHNLCIWREAAIIGRQSCRFIARQLMIGNSPLVVQDLPIKWKGVYFLSNSFPACVLLNSDGKLHELPNLEPRLPAANTRVFRWENSKQQFQLGR